MGPVRIQRVYDHEPAEGTVFLVDRLWPRGVRKADLHLDGWLKDLAPATELRQWFGHRPERYQEFASRYRAQLDQHPDALRPLLDAARRGPVTLLYAAKDTEHNEARVLCDHVRKLLARSSAGARQGAGHQGEGGGQG
ncbi:DUF488 domain-containing protein [Nonomuraea cavernae]|uniref:DUF488 domain-containing protein n=1 Tax=Nonomuraea cavernae TaxID=2045107 RepID=A0A917YN65_9ACTN|nr:DUF488 family protein [Nonomuraea cavernae]MCA2183510.1 DUF488 family protein [Nonomuraea cavernae]GGO60511.1 hypothetical protein GCM10012289_00550 [Nonomuraea cavernae]